MSKWRDATTDSISARKKPLEESTASDGVKLRRFLPLLLLASLLFWFWNQLPEPLPDSPRNQASDFEQRGQPETVAMDEGALDAENLAPRIDEPLTPAPVLEPEFPSGGFSPLDWRPIGPLVERPAQLRSWYQNYDGYIRALRRRSHVNKPMILFFRADWCPWSRRLESEFLLDREIANWTAEQIRVVFDADAGPEEAELLRKLGVTGLPAFFVVPTGARDVRKIEPFPGGESLSPEQFLLQSRSAL
jgi:hypothetical protein